MKVLMKSGNVRDVSPDVGEVLLASNLADPYVAPVKDTAPPVVNWSIEPATPFDPPSLRFTCKCGPTPGYVSSTRGTAHLTGHRHNPPFSGVVLPPQHIAEEYQRQFKRWPKPKPAKISAAVGYTPEQLRAFKPKSAAR